MLDRGCKTPIIDHITPLWNADSNAQDQADSPLHILCNTIPQMFPHLRRLYISFQCWLNPGSYRGEGDPISEVETIFLGPVEDMMRSYLQRRPNRGNSHDHSHGDLELQVAIQRGGWHVLLRKYHKLLGDKLIIYSDDDLSRGRFWKPLRLNGPADTSSGGAGAGYEEKDGDGCGYWICGGFEDMRNWGLDYWLIAHWGEKWVGLGRAL